MSAFKSERVVPLGVPDLAPVSADLVRHFQDRGYEAMGVRRPDDAWEISITKGGVFKAAVGLRTALKVELLPQPGATLVRAGAGVFGKQAVPTALTLFVAWPVLLTQAWGLINQAGLDDEAIKAAEVSLNRLARLEAAQGKGPDAARSPFPDDRSDNQSHSPFCAGCGERQLDGSRFCPHCGTPAAGKDSSR